ncbi:hypothetical protein EYM_05660 [Ignicoccus islandicus DSM 13165]|uniref:DUF432 domain-containing protein n=1 Tax=Ignicoccus islandicus DSM 13165 TaxID=940295 RepID=A0A0U3FQJ4_9CREN|nr:DUF432 domain-containing protein [Ignicoccus islandicus]ALU12607.1 hypothetical protein EYM_05660 [Ignicoccus islandicus DSM 13165]
MRYFGKIRDKDEVKEGKWTVSLKCNPSLCIYRRTYDTESLEMVLSPYSEVYLRPILHGGELAFYLYLKFSRNVTLAPLSTIQVNVGIPIDVEASIPYMGPEGVRNFPIDIIELTDVNYALYGKPERGLLCRYHEVRIGRWNWLLEAPLNVLIANESERSVNINRIVFPTFLPKLYYFPGTSKVWVSPINVFVEGNTATVVRNDQASPPEGYIQSPSTGKTNKWVMIFGL